MILWYGMICTGLGILIFKDISYGRVRLPGLVVRPRNGGFAYLCTETPIRSLNPQETLHDPLVRHDLHWSRNSDIHGEEHSASGISQIRSFESPGNNRSSDSPYTGASVVFITDP